MIVEQRTYTLKPMSVGEWLKRYQEDRHQGRYRPEDIETVLASLRTRDPEKISSVVSGMLQDFFID